MTIYKVLFPLLELLPYNIAMKKRITLFHGSDHVIDSPVFGGGSPKNDYGFGFYCTPEEGAAKVWANRNGGPGYVNQYEIDVSSLQILDLTAPSFDAMYWISLLLQHRSLDDTDRRKYKTLLEDLFRTYPVSIDGVDLIIGYRADDRYFRYCKDFLSSQLDYDSLTKALKLEKLGIQYVLLSPKAFQNIHFIRAEKIGEEYLHSYSQLMEKANDEYQIIMEGVDQRNGLFIRDKLYGKR